LPAHPKANWLAAESKVKEVSRLIAALTKKLLGALAAATLRDEGARVPGARGLYTIELNVASGGGVGIG
jgi:hypothetical protein